MYAELNQRNDAYSASMDEATGINFNYWFVYALNLENFDNIYGCN